MAEAKTREAAEVAELIDLQWDGQPKERSLDYDAHVELPDIG